MNKIQYIKLLALRGITELKGESIASAVRSSGGDPTTEEMVKVNQQAMEHYIHKFQDADNDLNKTRDTLETTFAKLAIADNWINALEAAGVDNWEGYDIAQDIRDGND